jgi:hypothetical protein
MSDFYPLQLPGVCSRMRQRYGVASTRIGQSPMCRSLLEFFFFFVGALPQFGWSHTLSNWSARRRDIIVGRTIKEENIMGNNWSRRRDIIGQDLLLDPAWPILLGWIGQLNFIWFGKISYLCWHKGCPLICSSFLRDAESIYNMLSDQLDYLLVCYILHWNNLSRFCEIISNNNHKAMSLW